MSSTTFVQACLQCVGGDEEVWNACRQQRFRVLLYVKSRVADDQKKKNKLVVEAKNAIRLQVTVQVRRRAITLGLGSPRSFCDAAASPAARSPCGTSTPSS